MLNIIEIKNKIPNGCTVPYIVWCDDGHTYVVKFPGNGQGVKALVNEFVASSIANYLELPILPYQLINVRFSDYKIKLDDSIEMIDGTAFATLYDPDATPIVDPGTIINSTNRNDAIKILIFDILMGNSDRNNGNLLVDLKTKKIVMIDHTHIFGLETIWDDIQLLRLVDEPFDLNKVHSFGRRKIMESIIYDKYFYDELNDFIAKVKNIDEKYIEKIINDIPNDWNVSLSEKRVLVKYIYTRFQRVDEVVELLNLREGCYL